MKAFYYLFDRFTHNNIIKKRYKKTDDDSQKS
jgi:hypothetical protein